MIPRGRLEALIMQVQNEFLDTPGLHLTAAEAERRFAADRETCEAVLNTLVDAGVLATMPRGTYVRFVPPTRRGGPGFMRIALADSAA